VDSIWSARSVLLKQGAAWAKVLAGDVTTGSGRDFDGDLQHL